ncbi:hypothetical protein [Sulfurimonas sp.]
MREYYQMTPKTCFLCKVSDGKVFDETTKIGGLIDCKHQIDVGNLELQIMETEKLLRDLKKSKRYAKIVKIEEE